MEGVTGAVLHDLALWGKVLATPALAAWAVPSLPALGPSSSPLSLAFSVDPSWHCSLLPTSALLPSSPATYYTDCRPVRILRFVPLF